ncbi:MAG: imidazole glycerol phosphate synthase subunit HisH [Acidimicrobiia bacterium]
MIGVLDYGVGNVSSILSMMRRLTIPATRVTEPDLMEQCDAFVLPGVGAFDDVVSRFAASGLRPALEALVLGAERPLLGICVGMQMLAHGSDEGDLPGLGWVPGRVRQLAGRVEPGVRLPVMGWYYTEPVEHHDLVPRTDEAQRYYFVHSYFLDCDEPADVAATVDYGLPVTAAVQRGVVSGTQFHPEKSHRFGMELLRRFAAKVPA